MTDDIRTELIKRANEHGLSMLFVATASDIKVSGGEKASLTSVIHSSTGDAIRMIALLIKRIAALTECDKEAVLARVLTETLIEEAL